MRNAKRNAKCMANGIRKDILGKKHPYYSENIRLGECARFKDSTFKPIPSIAVDHFDKY